MIYSKPPLTINAQADLLISRGFIADKDKLLKYLKYNNYYRLTGYLYPFKGTDERYSSSVNLEKIISINEYDQKLRNHLLSAIDKIETAFKQKQIEAVKNLSDTSLINTVIRIKNRLCGWL